MLPVQTDAGVRVKAEAPVPEHCRSVLLPRVKSESYFPLARLSG